jgi:transposase
MRFVPIKEIEQQDIQAIHRIRSRLIKGRTAIINQVRGLLLEYGIVIPQGVQHVRKQLPIILDNMNNQLSILGRKLFHDLLNQLRSIDANVKEYDNEIKVVCQRSAVCKRIMKIEGVGMLTATAIVAAVGDAKVFKNGREMAAFLGLVPRQHSSGGKQRLLGISKRGESYLRTLLVHGARAVVTRSKSLPSQKMLWLKSLVARRGNNRAIVALANKNARVIWAMMTSESEYQQAV